MEIYYCPRRQRKTQLISNSFYYINIIEIPTKKIKLTHTKLEFRK